MDYIIVQASPYILQDSIILNLIYEGDMWN